jgi:hypothetical protein
MDLYLPPETGHGRPGRAWRTETLSAPGYRRGGGRNSRAGDSSGVSGGGPQSKLSGKAEINTPEMSGCSGVRPSWRPSSGNAPLGPQRAY